MSLRVKNVSRALRSISLTLVCRRMVRSGGCERTSGRGVDGGFWLADIHPFGCEFLCVVGSVTKEINDRPSDDALGTDIVRYSMFFFLLCLDTTT